MIDTCLLVHINKLGRKPGTKAKTKAKSLLGIEAPSIVRANQARVQKNCWLNM